MHEIDAKRIILCAMGGPQNSQLLFNHFCGPVLIAVAIKPLSMPNIYTAAEALLITGSSRRSGRYSNGLAK